MPDPLLRAHARRSTGISLQTEHGRPGEPVRDGPSGRLPSPKKELQALITRRKADQGDPAASGRQQATVRTTGRIHDGGAESGHRRRVRAAIREDERPVINIHSSPVIRYIRRNLPAGCTSPSRRGHINLRCGALRWHARGAARKPPARRGQCLARHLAFDAEEAQLPGPRVHALLPRGTWGGVREERS